MSKIGKKIVLVPENIEVFIEPKHILVKRDKKEIKVPVLPGVSVRRDGISITFSITDDRKQFRSNWGTNRALLQNAITGMIEGFSKTLILEGVGYRMSKEGNDLILNLGFSHPVRYHMPDSIAFDIENNTILKVRGNDKALVGQVAAEIRALKKPEPYKGKGMRYADESVRRKAGKKAAGATGTA